MKIIVIGGGKIGETILASLSAEGHDLTLVDKELSVVTDITEMYDVMGVCGSGTDCDILSEAEVETAELVVAVTGSDEFNMLSCFLARKMGAKHTIARIRNPEYNDRNLQFMKSQLNISMAINPEHLAATEIYNVLKLPSAAKVETFSARNFEMVELVLKDDSVLCGKKLMDLRKEFSANFLVCTVLRGTQVYIPDGNFVLNGGDRIGLMSSPSEINKLLKHIGIMQKKAKNIIILGASRTSYYLAKMLLGSGNSVKIVDRSADRCGEFCEALPEATIINGDASQQEVLLEEGIEDTDAFAALTGIDEENILLSFFAASKGVPKVITKVNRDEFADIADNMGLETIVSPKKIIANVIVRYARALENSIDSKMETLYKLMDGKVEAAEFVVSDGCPVINVSLKEMQLKKDMLIAGIIRGRKSIIPSGDDMILPDDHVVVLSLGRTIHDITDILKK